MSEENMTSEPFYIKTDPEKTIYLARWSTRFWAFLIDIILFILFLNIIRDIFKPIWKLPLLWDYQHWGFFSLGFEFILLFAYWTVFRSPW